MVKKDCCLLFTKQISKILSNHDWFYKCTHKYFKDILYNLALTK